MAHVHHTFLILDKLFFYFTSGNNSTWFFPLEQKKSYLTIGLGNALIAAKREVYVPHTRYLDREWMPSH